MSYLTFRTALATPLAIILLACGADAGGYADRAETAGTTLDAGQIPKADDDQRDAKPAAAQATPSLSTDSPSDAPVLVDAGGATEAATPVVSPEQELDCYPLLAHGGDPQSPYAVGIAEDAYTAFTFKAPWQGTVYAVLFRPVLDNKKAFHHWLLFRDDSPGTVGPGVVGIGNHPDAALIAAWVPGTDALDLRKTNVDVGLELSDDTTYTLEIHYNSSDENNVDRSGVEVCAVRKKPANIASYSWLGTENWLLPSTQWTGTCTPTSQEPIHVISILPHMHLVGKHFKVTVNRKDGTIEVLHDDDFDFAYERLYMVDVTLQPGDTITSACTYSEPKTYGPRVVDEMCYLFTMAYPSGALTSADTLPLHGGSCLGQ